MSSTLPSTNPDLRYFSSIPWCSKYLESPGIVAIIPKSRLGQNLPEHELFSTTFNNDKTISNFLVLYKPPPGLRDRVDELQALITVGFGLNGFPGVCHGGLVATLLDEVMGMLPVLNMERGVVPSSSYMTGYLNTKYIFPVRTQSTVLVTAHIEEIRGRKWYIEGMIQDEKGTILSKGSSLYIALKPKI